MEVKTTYELNNYEVTHNSKYHLESKWVSVKSLLKFMNENSNPCMKCGSIQCAICSDDLLKELKGD